MYQDDEDMQNMDDFEKQMINSGNEEETKN